MMDSSDEETSSKPQLKPNHLLSNRSLEKGKKRKRKERFSGDQKNKTGDKKNKTGDKKNKTGLSSNKKPMELSDSDSDSDSYSPTDNKQFNTDKDNEKDVTLAVKLKGSMGDNVSVTGDGPEQPDEESELSDVKAELSQMSFEELQQLKEKLGMKVFNQVMYGKGSKSTKRQPKEKKVFKREDKSRPMEMTSKKMVSRFRHVIPTKKKVVRDPRFDEKSGEYSDEYFKKFYSFLDDVKEREREKLRKQLGKAKDPETKTKIKSLLNRMGQQQMAEEQKVKKAEKEKEWTKREKELVAQGKKPFFLKQSDKRKLELAEKYRELQKSGKLEKYLSKKRKKNSQKERRKLMT